MAAAELARHLNPITLNLHKLALELKCPSCLNLFNNPILLPCNHALCHACVGSECAECKQHFIHEDLRPAPYLENVVKIFRNFDLTFTTTLVQPLSSGAGQPSELLLGNSQKISQEKSGKEGTSSNRQSMVSLKGDMENHALLNVCTRNGRALVSDAQDKAQQHVGLCTTGCNGLVPTHGIEMTDDGVQRVEFDMNHEPQPSPGSSNSISVTRAKDWRTGDPLSTFSDTKISKTRKIRDSELVMSRYEVDAEPTKENSGHVMDTKRQKKQFDYVPQGRDNTQLGSSMEDIVISKSNMKSKTILEHIAAKGKEENCSVCAFCHSSKICDGSGEMLHFANGKEVAGEISHHSNTITVHSKCIDWTPQVYYEGDNIKNLESELARAAKLKCDCCGLKGAGLGCLAKTCRKTYHVPCAVDVRDCRWDCDDFLMLCPSHNNLKFPREKLKRRKLTKLDSKTDKCPNFDKDVETNHKSSKQLNLWVDKAAGQRDWVFCGSALSSEERHVVVEFARMCGAKLTKIWEPNVTHVIAGTGENGAYRRTLKALMAILHGRWVVSMDWVKACMGAHAPVNEEPYEFSLDNHGCRDGPKAGRLRVITNDPKLFDGMLFYFCGDFVPDHKRDMEDLVCAAGGFVIISKEQFMVARDNTQSDSSSCIVAYNRDPPPGCLFEEEEFIISRRKAEAEDVGKEIGAKVVRHSWMLESIAACKKIPYLS